MSLSCWTESAFLSRDGAWMLGICCPSGVGANPPSAHRIDDLGLPIGSSLSLNPQSAIENPKCSGPVA